jgi:2-desacetyl-2-hydroxyethyl bacteriochlorophyllide A dehydrogenase
MKTITLQEPGRFSLTGDAPEPGTDGLTPGEALVRVRRVGVCGTDYHAYRGRQPFFAYPRVLGHELGVEVVAVGAGVENVAPGDACAVEPYLNCGACVACRRGKPNCCTKLTVLGVHADGGMRDYLVLPARKLHPSRTLTLEQLALVETLGIGAHAVARAQIEAGETALVLGAGPIGLSVVPFLLAAGAGRVIVRDPNAARLAFARREFAVSDTLDTPDADATLATLSDLTGGDLPTVVFDATGNPQSMMEAFRYVAHGGRLVFVGLFAGDVTFHDPEFHRREVTLLASRNSTPEDFGRIIGLMESGRIDTRPWVTHRVAAPDLPAAFDGLLDPSAGVLKAVVEF